MPTEKYSGKSLLGIPSDYTVLDIETTGTSSRCEILEIGALCVRSGEIADEFSRLVKPFRPIPPFITALTGIADSDVCFADGIEDVLPSFLYFAGNDLIVGHNVRFDLGFITGFARCAGLLYTPNYVDTLRLSRKLLTELPHHRLCDLAAYYKIEQPNAHRALGDCFTTYEVLNRLAAEEKLPLLQCE